MPRTPKSSKLLLLEVLFLFLFYCFLPFPCRFHLECRFQLLGLGVGSGWPTGLVSDYCCFSSAHLSHCSTNRYLGKHAHHAQCPPALGGQSKQPQPARMITLHTLCANLRLLLSSSNFLVSEGHPSLLQQSNQVKPGMLQGNTQPALLGKAIQPRSPRSHIPLKGKTSETSWSVKFLSQSQFA